MDRPEDIKKRQERAHAWADKFLSTLNPETDDSRARNLADQALQTGWIEGYASALADVLAMQEVAGAVKH